MSDPEYPVAKKTNPAGHHERFRFFRNGLPSPFRRSVWKAHFLSALTLIATVYTPGAFAQSAPDSPEPTTEELQEMLSGYFREVRRSYQELPRESFDTTAILAEVGDDPEALRDWMAESIAWVPYEGLLRGPRGTLMDRTGNSLDRAFLLATLLMEAGHKGVELARGEVDADNPVYKELRERTRSSQAPPVYNLPDKAETSSQVEQSMLEQKSRYENLLETIAFRTESQLPVVRGWLDEAHAVVPASEATREHWWVLMENADGESINLDPSGLEGIKILNTVSPEETAALSPHKIEIEIVIEQWKDGEFTTKSPLQHEAEAWKIAGQSIEMGFNATDLDLGPSRMMENPESGLAELEAKVAAQRDWLPYLLIGEETIVSESFNTEGELHTNHEGSTQGRRLGQATGLLGGLGQSAEDQNSSALTALWIDLSIIAPDGTRQTERRTVFDLLDPSERSKEKPGMPDITEEKEATRGLALLSQMNLLVLTGHFSRPYSLAQAYENLLRNRRGILGAVHYQGRDNPEGVGKAMGEMRNFPGELYQWANLRREMHAQNERIYLAEPNWVAWHDQVIRNNAGESILRQGMDLVFNRVAVTPDPDGPKAAELRMEQGLLDTIVEAILVSENNEAPIANSSNALEQLGDEAWAKFRSMEEIHASGTELDPEALPYIRSALNRGKSIVLLTNAAAVAYEKTSLWWELDERTGHLLGRSANGWGAAQGEYILTFVGAKNSIFILGMTIYGCKDDPGFACYLCAFLTGAILTIMTLGNPEKVLAPALGGNMLISVGCGVATS